MTDRTYTDAAGDEYTEFPVVRFTDAREDQRWFNRSFDALGCIRAPSDGGVPCDPSAVLKCARDAFGLPCEVLWP